jgi:hypothetical protein
VNDIPTSATGHSTDLGAFPTFLESAQEFRIHSVVFIEGVAVIGLRQVRWAVDLSERGRESRGKLKRCRIWMYALKPSRCAHSLRHRSLVLKKEKIMENLVNLELEAS